jgi:hypothetical protein
MSSCVVRLGCRVMAEAYKAYGLPQVLVDCVRLVEFPVYSKRHVVDRAYTTDPVDRVIVERACPLKLIDERIQLGRRNEGLLHAPGQLRLVQPVKKFFVVIIIAFSEEHDSMSDGTTIQLLP